MFHSVLFGRCLHVISKDAVEVTGRIEADTAADFRDPQVSFCQKASGFSDPTIL